MITFNTKFPDSYSHNTPESKWLLVDFWGMLLLHNVFSCYANLEQYLYIYELLGAVQSLRRHQLKLDLEASGLAHRIQELLSNVSEEGKHQESSLS